MEYCKYWLTRFPHLPSHAYHVMQKHQRDSTFNRFFVRYFNFTSPAYHSDQSLDNHELVELQKRVKIEMAAANNKKWFDQKHNQNQQVVVEGGWRSVGNKSNNNNNNNKSKRGFYNFKNKNAGGVIERRGSGSSTKECDENKEN
jgi:hypothetical protein